jgi:hypothetical protein
MRFEERCCMNDVGSHRMHLCEVPGERASPSPSVSAGGGWLGHGLFVQIEGDVVCGVGRRATSCRFAHPV